MITELTVKNFKCFRDQRFELRPLTVLAGLNGAGKSTVIQSLLLAELAGAGISRVPLSGQFGLSLGSAQDVLNRESVSHTIEISKTSGPQTSSFQFAVPDDPAALSLEVNDPRVVDYEWGRVGAYLCAERLGPRDALEVASIPRDAIGVGHQGEFTAQILAEQERRTVALQRRFGRENAGSRPETLASQVEAWLSSIVRPTQVAASRVPGTSLAILRFREPTVAADWVRPANVGFGLSYALPILVAGLTVAPGSMFLIENPEAHLHPAGQSRMGQFLARLAAAGVQVVVETHSDHLLNGMRKSIARQELSAAAFLVHFFGPEGISTLEARETGGLNDWPPSFFDQLEVDLTDISRAGSGS